MRIKNNQRFYDLLHELEDKDPNWHDHVGTELHLDEYADDGDPYTEVGVIKFERNRLKKIRELVEPEYHGWRTSSKRDGIRLFVTMYRQYRLSYAEISDLLGIPASTIRHDYHEAAVGEVLDGDYRLVIRSGKRKI